MRSFRIEIRFCDDCVRAIRRNPEDGFAAIFTCPTCCPQAPTLVDAMKHLFGIPDVPTPEFVTRFEQMEERMTRGFLDLFDALKPPGEPKPKGPAN